MGCWLNERPSHRIGCLLVDEHPVVRGGLRRMLEESGIFEVDGEASSLDRAVDLARRTRPALAILGLCGQAAGATLQALRDASPRTIVMSFLAAGEPPPAGVDGVISRSGDARTILRALRVAARVGETTVSSSAQEAGRRVVSPREREVLELLADGLSNRQISDRLVVSLETIKTHVRNILTKLGAASRAEAVAVAIRQGIIR
jgi:DNA-binding NarL/FixJ family response regulator